MLKFNEYLNELSTELLSRYKTQAGKDASAADKAGDFKKGNKRFSGIMKATKKQFANDLKKEDVDLEEGGLWDNIHAKRERIKNGSGERMRKPGSKGAPTSQDFKDASEEVAEEFHRISVTVSEPDHTMVTKRKEKQLKYVKVSSGLEKEAAVERGKAHFRKKGYKVHDAEHAGMIKEATYQGKKVPLNKPMKGDVKKSKVYVDLDGDGKATKVNFGDKNMTIKKHIPARKKSFRARHNCDNPGPKDKARYWSCKAW